MNRSSYRLLLPLAALLALPISAQTPQPPAATANITLGQSIFPLNGPWKFSIGDSPIDPATGQPLWAEPTFDDAAWQSYTLDPKHPTLTAVQALQLDWLPGWQSHGHPAYTGYGWYRIRLQAPPNAPSLALLMPQHVNDAYDLYVNGHKIGEFGHLDRWRLTYTRQPKLFSIPATALDSGHPVTLALRFWLMREGARPSEHNLAGGLRGVPLLGPPGLLQVFLQSARQQATQTPWRYFSLATALVTVGIICLFLFLFSRRQREYLWAGINLTSFAVAETVFAIWTAPSQTIIPLQLEDPLVFIALFVAIFALPLAAMYLLSVPKPLWRCITYAVSALIAAQYLLLTGVLLGLLPPTAAMDRILGMSPLFYLPMVLLLLAITVDGLRTIGRKAWLLLTPGVFFALFLLSPLASTSRFLVTFFVISKSAIYGVPLSVLIIFLLRFTRQQKENARLVDDMKQAQEVQQVLIPEELPRVPGLTIETEYRPAREVGGDFFQIIPHSNDGSVLIVAGDVTGKGLQAGMLVALLVGAIRTAADTSSDPLHILQTLNKRLLGRGHAQATCLALHITPDGQATLANAGHIPPYLNGNPIAMEGSLPLGMIENADFSVMHFHLDPNDKLVLISDGILEATDPTTGQLFGFDRVQQHLHQNLSPSALADAAQHFGQQDDISLIALTRNPLPA